jgi:hypothetical protein
MVAIIPDASRAAQSPSRTAAASASSPRGTARVSTSPPSRTSGSALGVQVGRTQAPPGEFVRGGAVKITGIQRVPGACVPSVTCRSTPAGGAIVPSADPSRSFTCVSSLSLSTAGVNRPLPSRLKASERCSQSVHQRRSFSVSLSERGRAPKPGARSRRGSAAGPSPGNSSRNGCPRRLSYSACACVRATIRESRSPTSVQ